MDNLQERIEAYLRECSEFKPACQLIRDMQARIESDKVRIIGFQGSIKNHKEEIQDLQEEKEKLLVNEKILKMLLGNLLDEHERDVTNGLTIKYVKSVLGLPPQPLTSKEA